MTHPEMDSAALERRLVGRIDYERIRHVAYDERQFRLDRVRQLMTLCGEPMRRFPILHITGTKGKGSTAAMLEAVLRAGGLRTGLFTSPHLVTLRERIRIDGEPISPERFTTVGTRILEMVERAEQGGSLESPTYFELLTAIGMAAMADAAVDVGVIEVGLGGRLDSTNICHPELSIITSIGLDHCEMLGDTPELIAVEKAGILKSGVPAICAEAAPTPREVIAGIAAERGSSLTLVGTDYDFSYTPPRHLERESTYGQIDYRFRAEHSTELHDVDISLPGVHQASNAACALAAIDVLRLVPIMEYSANRPRHGTYDRAGFLRRVRAIPESAVRMALGTMHWPGRIEIIARRPTILFDAAHNPMSLDSLVRTLDESFDVQRRILILAATRDRELDAMLRAVRRGQFDIVLLTCHSNRERAVPTAELADAWRRILAEPGPTPMRLETPESPHAAMALACQIATPDDLICATGSFYLLADLLKSET